MPTRSKQAVREGLIGACVVAVIRAPNADSALRTAEVLLRGGVGALEVTLTVPGAVDVIKRIARETDAFVGAGTVLTREDVEACASAGAQFIVSPACLEDVVQASEDVGLVVMPGAFTPTEVLKAWRWGADFVKVFPAARLGSQYLADLRGPLPGVLLVPTGGITGGNARDFLMAGATLLGLGSWLSGPQADGTEGERETLARARQLIEVVDHYRRENA